jgi:hypothetical protein
MCRIAGCSSIRLREKDPLKRIASDSTPQKADHFGIFLTLIRAMKTNTGQALKYHTRPSKFDLQIPLSVYGDAKQTHLQPAFYMFLIRLLHDETI